VNERDELGSDPVPDYLTSVKDGAFYGWPFSYYGQHLDDRVMPQRPDLVAKAGRPRLRPRQSHRVVGTSIFKRDLAAGTIQKRRIYRATWLMAPVTTEDRQAGLTVASRQTNLALTQLGKCRIRFNINSSRSSEDEALRHLGVAWEGARLGERENAPCRCRQPGFRARCLRSRWQGRSQSGRRATAGLIEHPSAGPHIAGQALSAPTVGQIHLPTR
jgi:hypothetical protein